ncbi:MAG: NUMOD3 domain-containing DNA-binding protein, partial [Chloroflexota bacterium]|nr:NUMOD3 domain-containing DNA-binding protein [Chloroflexota bacterium]
MRRRKITIEYVKKLFEEAGYTLLSKEYVGYKQKLEYVCSKGHNHSMGWNKWQQGRRCPTCKNIKLSRTRMGKDNPMYGRSVSKKTRKKISEALRGKYVSKSTRKKLSNINKGKTATTEAKNKMRKARLGTKLSEKTKRKIGNASRKFMGSVKQREKMSKRMVGKNNPMFGRTGSKSPGWKGGISCEPYCQAWSDKEYKESIKQRDEYRCQNPYCYNTTKRLNIHHIDYNKKNCGPDNLITLCVGCNARANKDRECHTT